MEITVARASPERIAERNHLMILSRLFKLNHLMDKVGERFAQGLRMRIGCRVSLDYRAKIPLVQGRLRRLSTPQDCRRGRAST
jgi:hypothetical protein